jgi:GTPase SAR1 family protein
MAFNLETGGEISIIKGGTENNTIIYLDANYKFDDKDDDKGLKLIKKKNNVYFDKLELPKNQNFEPYPNTHTERQVLMIVGQSGSGKSYYLNQYIKNYAKAYKNKRSIYFISNVAEDKSINEKLIKRVALNESWLTEPLTVDDVKDSLVCFDDIEMIKDQGIKTEVFKFINEILTTGRHTNTSCALIVHYANNKGYLRDFLNETHCFTYFPRSSNRGTVYLLENYLGLDLSEIKKIKKLNTRWATVMKNYPNSVLTEKNLFMLANMDT